MKLLRLFFFCLLPVAASLAQTGGWVEQSPSPLSGYINGGHFVDANTIVLVGERNRIVRSSDGGTTWSLQNTQVTENIYASHFIDQSLGWAVGAEGIILKTTNGGDSWTYQTSGTTMNLYAVYFVDFQTGWAMGEDRKIVKTTDGGTTWTSQSSEMSLSGIYDAHFINSNVGVAVGHQSGNHVFRTIDGGQTWSNISLGTAWATCVDFVNENLGFAAGITASQISYTSDPFGGGGWSFVGLRATVWKTVDGGLNWVPSVFQLNTWLRGIHFTDSNTGWMVGDNGLILQTTDGGNTWTPQISSTTNNLLGVYSINAQNVWAIGASGTILNTSNGGTTWQPVSSGTTSELTAIQFVSTQTGWICGNDGLVLKTTDAGSTWQQLSGGGTKYLYAVHFPDQQNGWAVGGSTTILATTDGGLSWSSQTSGVPSNLKDPWFDFMSVFFVDPNSGWAVGSSGTIVKTTNGGATWTEQASGNTEELRSVFFIDSNTGWISGRNGLLLSTTNGGTTWNAKTSGSTDDLHSVFFLNDTLGWITGGRTFSPDPPYKERSVVLCTKNGGTTWKGELADTSYELKTIFFLDSKTGWTAGSNGTIMKSLDGGITWGKQMTDGGYLTWIRFRDASNGWASGGWSLLKTIDGGGTTYYGPTLVSPIDDAGSVPTNPTLIWNSIAEAVSYCLQVADNYQFINPVLNYCTVADTQYQLQGLTEGSLYYWRVMAEYASSVRSYSPINTFTTVRYYTPTLVSPIDGARDVPINSTLIWNSIDEEVSYCLQVANNYEFINPVLNYCTVADTQYQLQGLTEGSLYYWHVMAKYADDLQFYSPIYTFTTASSWKSQTSGTENTLNDVSFTDANTGTVVGDGGTILRTTNGGATWTSQTSGTDNTLNGVSFTDTNTGTVVGDGGTILRTTNGGATWTEQTSETWHWSYGVCFTDANTGTVVGMSGTILRTTNGGATWTSQSSGTENWLKGVSFTDTNTGTVVGDGGTILRTANGGATWTSQSSGTTEFLEAVCFTDANTGTAVGWGGTILRTTNGGTTWTSQSIGTGDFLYEVSFTDANTGTAVGFSALEGGTILRTTNGGVNWARQPRITWRDLNGVSFTDAYTGTVVGKYGTILRYTNMMVSVDNDRATSIQVAQRFLLEQNYPNPFNPSTTISFSIPTSEFITLKVFDVLGREVATLVNEEKQNGIYTVDFDAATFSSGIYFYTLKAGKFSQTKKLVLMK